MRSALSNVEGISEDDVNIDFEAKTATVSLADMKNFDVEALLAAVKEAGFGASIAN